MQKNPTLGRSATTPSVTELVTLRGEKPDVAGTAETDELADRRARAAQAIPLTRVTDRWKRPAVLAQGNGSDAAAGDLLPDQPAWLSEWPEGTPAAAPPTPRCAWTGCREPVATGRACADHVQAGVLPAVSGGAE
jgi:hypothetical protein